jgi:hypothetical protein
VPKERLYREVPSAETNVCLKYPIDHLYLWGNCNCLKTLKNIAFNLLETVLRVGGIRNCDFTPQDVEIAEKIFGPDVSELKGKSTRRKPKIVKYDVIAVSRELKQHLLELAIDIMFICSIPMLTTIDRTIKF